MKSIAFRSFSLQAVGVLAGIFLLAGCSGLPLPDKPQRPVVFDFGPGVQLPAEGVRGAPLAFWPVEAPAPLEGQALTYRLIYADAAQQPQPYAMARWSMSPAQLVGQRLRETLAAQRPVVDVGQGLASLELRVQLEEFSHVFDAPGASYGLVRLRATVFAPLVRGERLLGQHTFSARKPAPSHDAPGGVSALTAATDDVARQLMQWLAQLPQPAQAAGTSVKGS